MGKRLVSLILASLILMLPISFSIDTNIIPTDRVKKFQIKELKKIDFQLKQKLIKEPSSQNIKVLVKGSDISHTNWVVNVLSGPPKERIKRATSRAGGKVNIETNDYVAVEISVDELSSLLGDDSVENVYLDKEYHMLLDESIPAIKADYARDLGYYGSGIKVAVLDTGIDYENPAFGSRVVLSNAFTGEDHTIDRQGHGTHVAGIIAGDGDLKGVAPEALLMNAKVLTDYGSGSSSSIIKGVEWAVENGADVISLSLGDSSGEQDIPLNNALQNAIDNGITVIIAAGNCGECGNCGGFEGVTTPGNFKEAITVGAVDNANNVACFSSGEDFGDYIKPDVAAPGVSILSYYIGGGTKSMSGTSMATPHIAGVAALLLQKNSSLSHYTIKSLLEENAVDLGDDGKDVGYGSGVVDVESLFGVEEENETGANTTEPIFSEPTEVITGIEQESVDVEVSSAGFLSLSYEDYDIAGCSSGYVCGGKCWSDCSHKPDHPHWNCGESTGKGTCCVAGAPYYYDGTKSCYSDPTDYGCYYSKPYYCSKTGNSCWAHPSYCETAEYCGKWFACDVNYVGNCLDDGYYCCHEDIPYYWKSDGRCHAKSEAICGDGVCSPGEWCEEEDCNPCDDSQCVSYYWEECHDPGELCCSGDNSDPYPDTTFGQYYCKSDGLWATCAPDIFDWCFGYGCHHGCEQHDDYYCTHEDGLWKWRDCSVMCSGDECVDSYCGNGLCEDSETKSSCSQDCNSDIKIVDFVSPPSSVVEGQPVTISVKVKNYGTVTDTTKVEVGIIPVDFFSRGMTVQSYDNIDGCCEENEYYETKEITLVGGKEEIFEYELYAPSRDSVDQCKLSRSAWGDSFKLIVAQYEDCGKADAQKERPIDVIKSCSSDGECVSEHGDGYRCNENKVCIYDPCPGECKNYNGYSCAGDVIKKCARQTDGCYDYESIKSCSGGSYCEPGEGSCQISNKNTDIQIEDAADGKLVYKQPGDLLRIKLDKKTTETIYFDYDVSVFTLINGVCSNGNVDINSDKECLFEIADDAETGKYRLKITGGDVETIKIIDDPSLLIITNKEKLDERFNDDKGVNDLLEQAYETATDGEKGIVYDLNEYFDGHPFGSYSSYVADPISPVMKDNTYSYDVARFIDQKCGSCKNTIVLGDDFVVPFYRLDYADVSYWNWLKTWFKTDTETEYIYTDQPYIKEIKKNMGDLDTLFLEEDYENVYIVKPDGASSSLTQEIDDLRTSIMQKFGYLSGRVVIKDSSNLDCDSYGALGGGTLIIIGTRENNNVLKCVPWFDIARKDTDTFKATIEIERNVWGKDSYAVVVSGDDVVSGLHHLRTIMEDDDILYGTTRDASTLYIHDLSNPPEQIGILKEKFDHVVGFAIGTCDQGGIAERGSCMSTDLVASIVPPTDIITDARDVAIYCIGGAFNKLLGREEYGYMDGLICGGSAAGTAITVGKYVTAVTVIGAVAGEGGDIASTVMKRGLKTAKVILKTEAVRFIKYLDKLKAFSWSGFKDFFKAANFKEMGKKGMKFFGKMGAMAKELRAIHKVFNPDVLASVIKNSVDYEFVGDAVKIMSKEQGLKPIQVLRRFETTLPDITRLRLLRNFGKYTDNFFEANSLIKSTGTKRIFRVDNRPPTSIIDEGIGFKSRGNSLDFEEYAYKNIPSRFIGSSETPKGAFTAAISTGNVQKGGGSYVYIIDPRSKNYVDGLATAPPHTPNSIRWKEREIAAIDEIHVDDVVGVVYMKEGTGEIIEVFENTNYRGKLNMDNIDYEFG